MGGSKFKNASGGVEVVREIYFPTTIYYQDIADSPQINELVLPSIYALRGEDQAGIHRSNVKALGSWHSKTNIHKQNVFSKLVQRILAVAENIYHDRGYDPSYAPMIDNMWVNIHPRYGFNRSHTHPNTLWSGCYYVQTPPGSGKIYFSDPRPQASVYSAAFKPDTSRIASEWSEVYYEAIAGRVIIFPAWLRHEVEPNMSEEEGRGGDRISIAFNLSQYKK